MIQYWLRINQLRATFDLWQCGIAESNHTLPKFILLISQQVICVSLMIQSSKSYLRLCCQIKLHFSILYHPWVAVKGGVIVKVFQFQFACQQLLYRLFVLGKQWTCRRSLSNRVNTLQYNSVEPLGPWWLSRSIHMHPSITHCLFFALRSDLWGCCGLVYRLIFEP